MKYIFSFVIIAALFAAVLPVSAKNGNGNSNVPEQDGDYADPDHPGVRVRVFVHGPKGNPNQNPVVPSCTDGSSNAVDAATGWKLPSGNWTYNLNISSVPSSVGAANLPTITQNSFNQWVNALVSDTTDPAIVRGADTTVNRSSYDGKNVIAWGNTSGRALATTYTRYYTSTGRVADVDTIFNKKFAWSWTPYVAGACGNPNTYDAQAILTHELGHWYGLDDHYTSQYANNTMYGYGSKGDIKADTITDGDTLGVQAIY